MINSGSGYDDLRGCVVNYSYNGFDDFNIAVYNQKIKWQGQKSYFKGLTGEDDVLISKVSEGIYFLSWDTQNGGDKVILNVEAKKVNAHYSASHDLIVGVNGSVHHYNTPAAKFPHGELTKEEDFEKILANNIEEMNLPVLDLSAPMPELEDDLIGRKELEGKIIKYNCEGDDIIIDASNKKVKDGKNEVDLVLTTQIAEGIFAIAWMIEELKKTVLINENTRKVYCHMIGNGKRMENIYSIDIL